MTIFMYSIVRFLVRGLCQPERVGHRLMVFFSVVATVLQICSCRTATHATTTTTTSSISSMSQSMTGSSHDTLYINPEFWHLLAGASDSLPSTYSRPSAANPDTLPAMVTVGSPDGSPNLVPVIVHHRTYDDRLTATMTAADTTQVITTSYPGSSEVETIIKWAKRLFWVLIGLFFGIILTFSAKKI